MVFSSTVFLFVFLPVLLILYYFPGLRKYKTWKNAVLLVFSLLFYAWGEPVFVFLMVFSILVNWAVALFLEKCEKHKKIWLVIGTVFDILVIAVFKYLTFISENIAAIAKNDSFIISIALPVGISFFTFQLMSYLFDIYYGNAKAQKNPFYVALYIALFPQLIAGPIVRYEDVQNEILERKETLEDFAEGFKRFAYGLAKKVLIANFVAQIADNVFDSLTHPAVLTAWLGAIAYTFQIYFDFSGYSDMAIGLGRMFGFHFLENFNYPYISKSITDFWRRWHISLSTWFRDYVYIPLGGNRVSKPRWIFNLFVVWLLTGIWHGANWTFVIWGLFYFVFLLIEKLTKFTDKIGFLSRIYTIFAIIIGWVIFRASDIGSAVAYIGHMFGVGANGIIDAGFTQYLSGTFVILIFAIIGSTPLVSKLFSLLNSKKLTFIEPIFVFAIFALSVFEIVCSTYNPFIYFNF